MSAIITNKFRIHNAEQFYESFDETAKTHYYLYVGRPLPFSSTTGGGTDTVPPTPIDNVEEEFRNYRDMLAAKKITSADVQFVIPRRDWTPGTVYDQYMHDYSSSNTTTSGATNLGDSTFVVMTDEFKVYKCMWNNGGATATAKPTHTSNVEVKTGDDYYWKYMYTLTSTQVQKFLTVDFMPVYDTLGAVTGGTQTSVSSSAADGEIRRILITSGGSGFTDGDYHNVKIEGDGTLGECSVKIAAGVITEVTVTTQGVNYRYADIDLTSKPSMGGGVTAPVFNAVIGPAGGHGYDSIKELYAFYVMTNTSLVGTEGAGDFVVDQDFRRVGVVRNPQEYGTTTLATDTTLNALKTLTFSGTPGAFLVDEVITGGTSGAKAEVVRFDAGSKKLHYIQTDYNVSADKKIKSFTAAETITSTSLATGVVDTLSNPEINYFSGDMLYCEQRAPIVRATDQTENIKLVIEF